MKYIISKKQYNLIVEQSAVGLPPSLATVDPKWTHETAMVLSIAAAFIPVVGPFLSSGIQLLDAAKYLEEGDKKMAGLMAMFAFLPGVITLVGKIPGIKTLGANGMKMLAQKISSNQLKNLTKVEQDVLQGLSKNKELVTTELNNVVKSKAAEVASKAANNDIKPIMKKLAQTGLSFSLSIGGYAAAGEAYSSIFDAVQKREEEESLKELEKQLTNLGYK